MREPRGFTLVELMVVVAILGVLIATAYPTYRTFRSRAIGAEASMLMKQILDAQIIYLLENKTYFPNGQVISIFHITPPNHPDLDRVKQALKVSLPVGHFLDFIIRSDFPPGSPEYPKCMVTIQSTAASMNPLPIFRGGATTIIGTVDKEGNISLATL